jgi:hypothetical protein
VTNSNSTEKKDIRKFGLVVFLFFGTLCVLAVWRERTIPSCFFGTLSSLGTLFVLLPGPSRPLYSGWLRVAHFIGKTITVLMLCLSYFLVITPSAFVKRIFGGRPLPVRPDFQASSYWVERTEPAQTKDRFLKRF